MEDDKKDLSTEQDTQETESNDQDTGTEETAEEKLAKLSEEHEKLKEEHAKSSKKAEDQERRAKIAEQKLKGNAKPEGTKPKSEDVLTQKDTIAILKANIHEDDIDTLQKFARSMDISIADALKNDEIRAVLTLRDEKRKTAEATSISSRTPRGGGKVSDDVILQKFSKGEIPEPGSSEAERLFWARRGGKK